MDARELIGRLRAAGIAEVLEDAYWYRAGEDDLSELEGEDLNGVNRVNAVRTILGI